MGTNNSKQTRVISDQQPIYAEPNKTGKPEIRHANIQRMLIRQGYSSNDIATCNTADYMLMEDKKEKKAK